MKDQKKIIEITIGATSFLFLVVCILALISNIRMNRRIARYLDSETRFRNEEIRDQQKYLKFLIDKKQKMEESSTIVEPLKIDDEA
ncbi:hypothetical protein MYP_667 [Sporocytophaga myxococcoides]|uniref:Uncharacterized protein n=1 Tax=Sporocytophaga myxococcoides TaxID=153721 RepID=A0A098L981_9BACT|nr:hypothetical protein [Sporocytophaga myxococcoides]GAL83440.1 hypothetical protein MYP_667 [Sporocytophaga myxococcoides]